MPGWSVLPASGSYLGGVDGPDVETLLVGHNGHGSKFWSITYCTTLHAEGGSEVLGPLRRGKGQQVGGEGKWGKQEGGKEKWEARTSEQRMSVRGGQALCQCRGR